MIHLHNKICLWWEIPVNIQEKPKHCCRTQGRFLFPLPLTPTSKQLSHSRRLSPQPGFATREDFTQGTNDLSPKTWQSPEENLSLPSRLRGKGKHSPDRMGLDTSATQSSGRAPQIQSQQGVTFPSGQWGKGPPAQPFTSTLTFSCAVS